MRILFIVMLLFVGCDDGKSPTAPSPILGCMDDTACNYDGTATQDDGSCDEYVELWGECYNIEETTSLILPNNQLSGEIPIEIGTLTNLTILNLSENELSGEIPHEFGELVNLTYLHLFQNQFTSIPESIGNLSNLQGLWLWTNQLTSLPESIGDLSSLNQLDLEENLLTSLPESICNYSPEIYVDGNYLCEEFRYDCIDESGHWFTQDQSNCCEGPEGQPNWTTCP